METIALSCSLNYLGLKHPLSAALPWRGSLSMYKGFQLASLVIPFSLFFIFSPLFFLASSRPTSPRFFLDVSGYSPLLCPMFYSCIKACLSISLLQGIFHFQLGRGEPMLHTRLRPHCKDFLEKIAKLYELHVFTFGSRLYAHTIAGMPSPPRAQLHSCHTFLGTCMQGLKFCRNNGFPSIG